MRCDSKLSTAETETTEITFIFAAIGALLATLAITLAMLWNPLS
jgi:hypothetical protein